jgi:hypothetical protein
VLGHSMQGVECSIQLSCGRMFRVFRARPRSVKGPQDRERGRTKACAPTLTSDVIVRSITHHEDDTRQ